MVNLKAIGIASAVSLVSIATFAISKIAAQRHGVVSVQANKEQKQDAPDDEVSTVDDPWKEIEKVVAGYYSADGINYKGTMKLLDETTSNEKVLEQMDFEYSLVGGEYYYKMGQLECVNKENLLMMVDNTAKSITVSRQKEPTSQKMFFNPDAFKKLLEEKNAAVKVTRKGNEKIITVDSLQDPSVQGYRIYYDPATYSVHKIEIGMVRLNSVSDGEEEDTQGQKSSESPNADENPTYTYMLDVSFDKIERLSLGKKDFHPENRFINISQNNIQLTPAYTTYSLVDAGE